jgi:hypothetical protein
MKTSLLSAVAIICMLTLSLAAHAQAPDWADANKRKLKYSEFDYLVGFASEPNSQKENPAELLKRVESYAKGQLIEYIQVTVKSETMLSVTETNKDYQHQYRSMNSSSSNLNLTGLKVETAYDQKGKTGYALVLARRSELLSYYKGMLNNYLTEAERKTKLAKEVLNSNSEQAFKLTLETIATIPDIEQSQSVIIALMRQDATEEDTHIKRLIQLKTDTDNLMRSAQRGSGNNLDDACFFIARGFKLQTGKLNNPVALSNFTYQDTKIASELSNRINQSLTTRLVTTAEYSIIPSGPKTDGHIITGTYWKENNEIKLIATLKKVDGSIVATAESYLPLSWLESNKVNYLPENFEDAYARMKAFDKDEVIKGDLNVEVWTNKGDDNLIFTEGERLKFFVRSNKECYIRFIYHLADNQSVLLLDNYYIAAHMANKVIELPDEFECFEPFGVETLQVNAQTVAFDPLRVRNEDGYNFIVNSLDEILVGTRGIKKVTSQVVDKAEKRIVFTTMKR